MTIEERVSLKSIFGGVPEDHRDAYADFMSSNDFPDPKNLKASTEYIEAYYEFKMQLAYLKNIFEAEDRLELSLSQIAYNIHKCEAARITLAEVATKPENAKAIQDFRQQEENNLSSHETLLTPWDELAKLEPAGTGFIPPHLRSPREPK